MKKLIGFLAGMVVMLAVVVAVYAQGSFTLGQTSASSGGSSSGGIYTVRDAIGEPGAGLSTGGSYRLIGGLALGGRTSPAATFTLNITTNGNGTVTRNPPGNAYAAGTVIQLTATPASGFSFAGWSGAVGGVANSVNVTMDGDKTVTATFAPIAPNNFVLTVEQTGNGTVTLNPPGGAYVAGTVVQISAVPAADFTFTSWGGAVTGTNNPISVTMDGDRSVTATFTAASVQNYTLTVNKTGNGTVTLNPAGGAYAAGTVVQISAAPAAGFTFSGWGGAVSGTTNPINVTMDGNKTVTATFAQVSAADTHVYLPMIQR